MFDYTIRRFLLMIPTGLAITFMVFFILQIAPDGPLKGLSKSSKQIWVRVKVGKFNYRFWNGSELTPELLEKLRMQYD